MIYKRAKGKAIKLQGGITIRVIEIGEGKVRISFQTPSRRGNLELLIGRPAQHLPTGLMIFLNGFIERPNKDTIALIGIVGPSRIESARNPQPPGQPPVSQVLNELVAGFVSDAVGIQQLGNDQVSMEIDRVLVGKEISLRVTIVTVPFSKGLGGLYMAVGEQGVQVANVRLVLTEDGQGHEAFATGLPPGVLTIRFKRRPR